MAKTPSLSSLPLCFTFSLSICGKDTFFVISSSLFHILFIDMWQRHLLCHLFFSVSHSPYRYVAKTPSLSSLLLCFTFSLSICGKDTFFVISSSLFHILLIDMWQRHLLCHLFFSVSHSLYRYVAKTPSLSSLLLCLTFSLLICGKDTFFVISSSLFHILFIDMWQRHLLCHLFLSVSHSLYRYVAKTPSLSSLLLCFTFSLSICGKDTFFVTSSSLFLFHILFIDMWQRHLLCHLFFSVSHSLYRYVAKTPSLSSLLLCFTFSLSICGKDTFFVISSSLFHILFIDMWQRHLLCHLFFSVSHSLYQYVAKTPSLSSLLLCFTFSLSICGKDTFFVISSSLFHILFIDMWAKTPSLSSLLLCFTFSLSICRQRHLLCHLFFSVSHSLYRYVAKTPSLSSLLLCFTFSLSICGQRHLLCHLFFSGFTFSLSICGKVHLLCHLFFSVSHSLYRYVAKTPSLSSLLLCFTFSLSICGKDTFFVISSSLFHILFIDMWQRHLLCHLFFSVSHSLYRYVGKDTFFVISSSLFHILFIDMWQRHLLCHLFFSVSHSLYRYVAKTPSLSSLLLCFTFSLSICGKDTFFVISSSLFHILFIDMWFFVISSSRFHILFIEYDTFFVISSSRFHISLSICGKDTFFVISSSLFHILFIDMWQRHLLCHLFFSVSHSLYRYVAKTPSLSSLLLCFTFSLSICGKDTFFVISSSLFHILFIDM